MAFLADLLVTSNRAVVGGRVVGRAEARRHVLSSPSCSYCDRCDRPDALALVYVVALAWSVLVELLAAAAWPDSSFGRHDQAALSTSWNPLDNEITTMLSSGSTSPRVAVMVGASALGLVMGAVASVSLDGPGRATSDVSVPRQSRVWRYGLVAILVTLGLALAQPVQELGCTQTSQLALTRALATGTARLDRWQQSTCDKAGSAAAITP